MHSQPEQLTDPPPSTARRKLRGAALRLAALWAVCASRALWGQGVPFCNLTDVRVRRVSNAVMINFESDGILEADGDWYGGGGASRRMTRISFQLTNAKLRTSSFVNVAVYPVSHIELAPPAYSREGVGVDVTLVLYRPGRLANVDLTWWDYDFMEGEARRGITADLRLSKDRRTFVVVITSDRQVQQVTDHRRAQRLAAAASKLSLAGDRTSLDVTAVNVGLRPLLQALQRQTGTQFALPDGVERLVSLHVTETSVSELVAALAQAYGLSVVARQGAYYFAESKDDERTAYDQAVSANVPLRYMQADDAVNLLPNAALPYVHADLRHNALAVSGPQWLVDKVRRDAAVLDAPPALMAFRLLAVEMRRSDLTDIGFTAQHWTGNSEWDFDSGEGSLSYRAAGQLDTDYAARLKALVNSGRARTRAQVEELTLSGGFGLLFAGQTRLLTVLRESHGRSTATLLPVDVGAQLRVRPYSSGDGPILLWLEGSLSTIVGEDPDTHMPILSRRRLETSLRVEDGQTILLSANDTSVSARATRGDQIVDRLPAVGPALRSRRDESERTELFLFLTVKTVTGQAALDFDDYLRSDAATEQSTDAQLLANTPLP